MRGDEVFACIVARDLPADGAAKVALGREIVTWCLDRLAYYKAPGFIAFVDALPLTSTQKIQRGVLKEQVLKFAGSTAAIDTRALKKRMA